MHHVGNPTPVALNDVIDEPSRMILLTRRTLGHDDDKDKWCYELLPLLKPL